jgi:chitin-binding protein
MIARKLALVAALGVPLVLSGSFAARVWAHGGQADPPDRGFFCKFLDPGGVENPSTDGCKAAKAAAGTSEVYQWNSLIQPNANLKGLAILPEGQLCNAGDPSFRGFNLAPAAAKYTAAPVQGGDRVIKYRGTAPHKTEMFKLYITKPGYDGSQPVMKGDLDLLRTVKDFTLAGDTFSFNVTLPQRAAGSKAVIFTEWDRVTIESGEGYFTCSDVVYQ